MTQTLKIIGISIMVVVLALSMVVLIVIGNQLPQGRVYDCGMAEWHPDYPPEVRAECRKIRSGKIVTT